MKIAMIAFLLGHHCLHGYWDPEQSFKNDRNISFDVLDDTAFRDLVNRVLIHWPDCACSEEKAEMIMELIALTHPQHCVEIGVFMGDSFIPIIAALDYLGAGHATAIDAWSNELAVKGVPKEDRNYYTWSHFDEAYTASSFIDRILEWTEETNVTVLHMTSERAASKVGPIDFLHLDGSFSEEEALRDVDLYLPKVKSGGHILLSNVLLVINEQTPKMQAMWKLYDTCELVCEIEKGNSVLFRKH